MTVEYNVPKRALPRMPLPDHDPMPGECPNLTYYVPYGEGPVAVTCALPEGHDGLHHGEYRGVEFDWEPPTFEELQARFGPHHERIDP